MKFMTMLLTFWGLHLAEIFILFLFWIAFTSAPVSGNSLVRGRLIDSSGYNASREGSLELTLNGGLKWYKLCDTDVHFDSKYFKIASVVCEQLGHGPPVRAEYIRSHNFDDSVRYNDDWCNIMDAAEVSGCSLEGSSSLTNTYLCTPGTIYVKCLPSKAEEYDVEVVLDPAFGYQKGLVLIYIQGQWGPICDYGGVSFGEIKCGKQPRTYDNSFSRNGSTLTFASPVLACDKHDEKIKSCSMFHVHDGPCDPDAYVTVRCKKNEKKGGREEYSSVPRYSDRRGFSPGYLALVGFVVTLAIFLYKVFSVMNRGQQEGQTYAGGTSLPAINVDCSTPSIATTISPSQETQPSSFQSYPASGMQEADNAPPYRSLPDDLDLPSYEDALRSQGASYL